MVNETINDICNRFYERKEKEKFDNNMNDINVLLDCILQTDLDTYQSHILNVNINDIKEYLKEIKAIYYNKISDVY